MQLFSYSRLGYKAEKPARQLMYTVVLASQYSVSWQ